MTRGNPIVAQFLATVPEILWEASLGVYLTVKGFKRSSPLLDATRRVPAPAPAVA
jgi:hypothetical protein